MNLFISFTNLKNLENKKKWKMNSIEQFKFDLNDYSLIEIWIHKINLILFKFEEEICKVRKEKVKRR